MVGENENDWDNYLDPVLFGIRTSLQESTKFTPFFLMHGPEARFPLEAERASIVSQNVMSGDIEERICCMKKLKDSIFPVAKSNIENSQSKQKQQYQKRKGVIKTNIRVGNQVLRLNMLKRTKKGHKMEDTWKGLYKVRYMSDKGSCLLHCIKTGKDIKQKVNISQLKLYNEPSGTNIIGHTAEVTESTNNITSQEATSTKSSKLILSRSSSPMPTLSSTTQASIKPAVLEKQLFDDSLLRFWRTGCLFDTWDSRKDDQTKVCLVRIE